MFRESFDPGSRHALMTLTAQGGSAFQNRVTGNAISGSTDGPAAAAPHWVKLVRAGDVFTGYLSADGTNWLRVASVSVPMGKKVYAGLALTAHNNAALNSALFDKVAVSP